MAPQISNEAPFYMVRSSDVQPVVEPEAFKDYPDLLTTAHVSEITGLCTATILSEIHAGRLPACRIGQRYFIPKTRFIEYVGA